MLIFTVRQPFFNLDESNPAEVDYEALVAEHFSEDSADDVQPEVDTDVEEEETEDVSEDVVEPDTDEEEQEVDEDEESEEDTLDEDTEIDMGEGRQPVKLSELKQGYLRQSDYTKKTQELAAQRKEFESEKEALKDTAEFDKYLSSNPYLKQKFIEMAQVWNGTDPFDIEEVMSDAGYAKYINHFMAENAKLKQELESLKGDYESLNFNQSMKQLESDLKAEYGDLVTDEYIESLTKRAKSENLSHDILRDIADGQLAKIQMQKAKEEVKQSETKTIQKLQEKRKKIPPQPKSKGQKPETLTKDVSEMTWEEIARSVL